MITTNVTVGYFFVTAKDPVGPWSDPIWVNIQGIDPSFFFETDRVYIQYANLKAIWQVVMNRQTGALLSELTIITKGSGGRDVEGPHLYRKGQFYYLLTAEGGTRKGHIITIRR